MGRMGGTNQLSTAPVNLHRIYKKNMKRLSNFKLTTCSSDCKQQLLQFVFLFSKQGRRLSCFLREGLVGGLGELQSAFFLLQFLHRRNGFNAGFLQVPVR